MKLNKTKIIFSLFGAVSITTIVAPILVSCSRTKPPEPPPAINTLNIKAKNIADSIFNTDIFSLVINNKINLNKFFSEINKDNIANIKGVKFSFLENGIKVIIFAKPNYIFSDNKNILESEFFNIKKYTNKEIIDSTTKGQAFNEEDIKAYLNLNKSYKLSKDTSFLSTTNLNTESFQTVDFIEEFPILLDKEKTLYLSNGNPLENSSEFSVRIIPKSYLNDWNKIKTIEPIKNNSGSELKILVTGYKSKQLILDEINTNLTIEMNSILDQIKVNGLKMNDLGKLTNITPYNYSNYYLNKFTLLNNKSLIYNQVSIHYKFTNITFDEVNGKVNFSLSCFSRNNLDGQLGYDSKTLIESKKIDNLFLQLKPKNGFAPTYSQQEVSNRVTINQETLNSLINNITKNDKSKYIPHKIPRNIILSTINNYDIKPNNVFFDYIADGDSGSLTVRLIERKFSNNTKIEKLKLLPNDYRKTFNDILDAQINPNTIDKILQEVTISGFKKFNDFSTTEKAGFTTFKSWYSWKRSFSVGIGRINDSNRYSKNSAGKYINDPKGEYMSREETATGSGFISHKFSDTDFMLSTNVHVLEGLKQANNQTGKWISESSSSYKSSIWKYNNYDYDYQNNLTFRQVNPINIPTDGKLFLDEFQRDGVKVDLTSGKITEYIYDLLKPNANTWPHIESKSTILNELNNIESIKIDNLFSKKYITSDDVKSHIIDPLSTTTVFNQSYQKNSEDFNVALDLGFIRIKFKNANNPINKIWDEIGPTSYAPVDDFVLTNSGSFEDYSKQDKLKSWNNISTGGYPSKDSGENINGIGYRYTFKGDGAYDQNNNNDYLKSIFHLNNSWSYGLNAPNISFLQKQNEATFGGASGSPIYDKNMNIIAILAHRNREQILGENTEKVNTTTGYPLITNFNLEYYGNDEAYSNSYYNNVRLLMTLTNYDVIKKWLK